MVEGKQVPAGIKLISILYYIVAVILIIMGLILTFAVKLTNSLPGTFYANFLGIELSKGLLTFVGILMIGLGIFGFFVAKNLSKAKPWARTTAIIFSVLGILWAIIFVIKGKVTGNILSLILNLLIGWYLLFSKSVKEAFV